MKDNQSTFEVEGHVFYSCAAGNLGIRYKNPYFELGDRIASPSRN